MTIPRQEVLKLFKNLMSYSKKLTLTDSDYFRRKVITEFRKNKKLTSPEEITFAFKVHVTLEKDTMSVKNEFIMRLVKNI